MTPRREIVLSALFLLAACGAASSGAPGEGAAPPTVGTIAGVGVLPSVAPEVVQSSAELATSSPAASTTLLPAIGASAESNRVILIGDSLMASAAARYGGQLCDVLVPAGWQVEVDAETSRFIDFARVVLKARLDAGWNAAVIFLGNNYNGDQIDFAARLNDAVIDLGDIPIVLLTVTEFRPDRVQVNEAIQTVAGLHSNVRVLDWASISAADAGRVLGSDGLHLTDQGRQALADAIGLTLGQAPAQPGKCLATEFDDDSEGSVTGAPTTTVKGTKKTTSTTVRPTSTTVRPTSTTVRPGGATTTTVRSGATTTTVRSTTTTAAPGSTNAPTTTPAPATTRAPDRTEPTTPPTTVAPPAT